MPNRYTLFDTDLGTCGIAWNERDASPAVTFFRFPGRTVKITESQLAGSCGTRGSVSAPSAIRKVIENVRRHLSGNLQDFRDVPLDLSAAGSFAQAIYRAAREIPAGQTTTYGGLAKAINRPGAARAVGQALGSNPIPLIIPCHRILAAGGKPGGFSAPGGVVTKHRLLQIENVSLFV